MLLLLLLLKRNPKQIPNAYFIHKPLSNFSNSKSLLKRIKQKYSAIYIVYLN